MYNTKLIVSGNSVELYKYSKVIKENIKNNNEGRRRAGGTNRNRTGTLHKAKGNQWSMMLTLTYREDVSIEQSKKDICKFVKQLRQVYQQFKYLYVIELTKRGRPHFHMLVDIIADYTDLHSYERYLAEIWSHGFVDIQMITNSKGAGHYISKYFTKDPIDTHYKLYGYSRNCIKPTEVKCLDTRDTIAILQELNCNVVYSNSYDIEATKNHVDYFVLEDIENEDK